MRSFVDAYFAADRAAASDAEWDRAHARLYRFTDPARDRYVALRTDDPEAADGFRDALRAFVRLYGFLSQVIDWHDPDLERLYLYGRHLLNRLPVREDASVDIGEVDLTHLRISRTGEHDLSLSLEGPQMLRGFVGDGRGPVHEPDDVPLSELIEAFNDRYGLGLADADKVWSAQQITAGGEEDRLRSAALVNDEENFGLVFDQYFDEVVIARHDDNGKLLRRYFDDDAFRTRLTDLARREVYRIIRRQHNVA
jgi:type I restriction enzyme R subunit